MITKKGLTSIFLGLVLFACNSYACKLTYTPIGDKANSVLLHYNSYDHSSEILKELDEQGNGVHRIDAKPYCSNMDESVVIHLNFTEYKLSSVVFLRKSKPDEKLPLLKQVEEHLGELQNKPNPDHPSRNSFSSTWPQEDTVDIRYLTRNHHAYIQESVMITPFVKR